MIESIQIIILIVLILFSAFFSGSETTIAASNKLRIKKGAENGNKLYKAAAYITDQYTRSISTLLVGNNLVNIAASSIATLLAVAWFGDDRGPLIATVTMTVLLLIFGETLPKILAAEYADSLICLISLPLRFLMMLFAPIVNTVAFLVSKIEWIWTPKTNAPMATTEELATIVDTIEEEGVFNEREKELIKSALELPDTTAREIMTPRVDVVAFDINEDLHELLTDEAILKYSRIPVYDERLDNIIGILSIKKLMRQVVSGEPIDVRSLLSEPLYVHMTRTVSSILREFRRSHTHVAVVIDEFGGMMGLLTLEDIMEEIVGEIYDERDEAEEPEAVEDEKTGIFTVDGSMNIYDLFTEMEYTPHDFDSEYTTVSGFITERLDRFPEVGDTVEYDRLVFEVLEVESRCVEKAKVTLKDEEEQE